MARTAVRTATYTVEEVNEDRPPVKLFDSDMGEHREPDVGAGEVADVGERHG